MESIEWILTEHKMHLAMLQLLLEEQKNGMHDAASTENREEEISGMVLASPLIDGMPHVHGMTSSTEWAVMKLSRINQDQQTLSNEIKHYDRLLRLYDAVMSTLNDDERWFIDRHYDNGCALASLPSLPNSPFRDLSRSTMSNYRKRLLQKVASFFVHLQAIGSGVH